MACGSRTWFIDRIQTKPAEPSGATRFIIVSQKIRQPSTHIKAIRLVRRCAVLKCDSSARQPDFRILWKVSIFQRMAYHCSLSMASCRLRTGKSVMSFQSIGATPLGGRRSQACNTVNVRAG